MSSGVSRTITTGFCPVAGRPRNKALEAVEAVSYSPARDGAGIPAPAPLSYGVAFEHLDTIEDARTDLAATLRILSLLIGSSRERDAGVVVTIERHFATDLAKLEAACRPRGRRS